MKSVASKEYWNSHWAKVDFEIAPEHHPVRKWIEKEVPEGNDSNCLEIGCYPGKFLAVFGSKRYKLYGVDMFSKTHLMSDWLSSQRYKVGTFYQEDFLNFETGILYDVVCSFGFIEHFKNWKEIINRHIELTKEGGLTIIEVPNLKSPLYYFLYKILEPEVLKNHELPAMDLNAIGDVFKSKECKIQSAQYIGSFYFRFVTKNNKYTRLIANTINSFSLILNLLPKSLSARYIGVIAIRK